MPCLWPAMAILVLTIMTFLLQTHTLFYTKPVFLNFPNINSLNESLIVPVPYCDPDCSCSQAEDQPSLGQTSPWPNS